MLGAFSYSDTLVEVQQSGSDPSVHIIRLQDYLPQASFLLSPPALRML